MNIKDKIFPADHADGRELKKEKNIRVDSRDSQEKRNFCGQK